jgi:hypothetical protein
MRAPLYIAVRVVKRETTWDMYAQASRLRTLGGSCCCVHISGFTPAEILRAANHHWYEACTMPFIRLVTYMIPRVSTTEHGFEFQ